MKNYNVGRRNGEGIMSYTLTKRSIKTCKKESPIGKKVVCENPKCNNTFVKKTGMHRFCCAECRLIARGLPKPKKKLKYKTISEVLETMKLMGYTKSYGMFCAEHPEALVKEI